MNADSGPENTSDHAFWEFVNIMQDVPADDDHELHKEIEPGHGEILTFVEDLADFLEYQDLMQLTETLEIGSDTKTDKQEEHLYENSRITVAESLMLTMAFVMRHKLPIVASEDLLSLLELHCPKDNNAVKRLSTFR